MFPDKPGGIALYAHEGWRKRFNLFGPIAAFGYWIGWSVVLSFFGNMSARSSSPSGSRSPATAVLYDAVLQPRLRGLRAGADDRDHRDPRAYGCSTSSGSSRRSPSGTSTGALLMVPLAIFIVFPYITGDWRVDRTSSTCHNAGGFSDLRIAADVALHHVLVRVRDRGVCELRPRVPRHEAGHRHGAEERRRCSRCSCTSSCPLGLGGVVGTAGDCGQLLRRGPRGDRGSRVGGFAVICLIASLILAMNTVDRRRRPRALRHRPRRHDDQVALPPEHVPRPRPRDDGRHGREHRVCCCCWARTTS